MAKIRRRKIETNYTVVENDFLRDRELGFTERGVLMTMLSLPDNWDFSAIGLASIVPDGKAKTYASLKKLEVAGYLQRSRIYEDGKVIDWLYEFCEQPIFKDENLLTENRKVDADLLTDFQEVENVEVENLQVENRENNKRTKELNTKKINPLLNQSINHREPVENSAPPKKRIADRLIDRDLLKDIKDQIQYDFLKKEIDTGFLDSVVSCIADLYTTTEPLKINKRTYAPDFVHKRSLEIEHEHVSYVWECFNQKKEKVSNIRAYLLTSVFNAPDTMGAYGRNDATAAGFGWD